MKKNLLVFGYGLGFISLVFALGGIFKHHHIQWLSLLFFVCSIIFVSTAFLNYMAFKPAYDVWMKVAHVIGGVVTTVILSVIFFLVFTPVGILLRILGKDHLERKFQSNASYWIKRDPQALTKERYRQQF